MADEIDLSGQHVGRYKLLSPLGAGGMGVVYDAIDSSLDRRVAVKVLSGGLVTDPARVQRFVLEARSASALDHPHVVSIHEVGTATIGDREIRFIAMEKVVGTTLRKAIASGEYALRRKLELAVQICEGIAAAHDAGIVHRDLKPENVMVSDKGYAKIVDFGLAKLRERDDHDRGETDTTAMMPTATGAIVGTSGYMSPEQAQGRPIDHRTDIFAIGCILYELVSGRRAFRGDSAVDTLHLIIHSEPEPIQSSVHGVPMALQRIVTKTLAKDPNQRYQSAKDVAIDLREVIEELALTHRRPEGTNPKRRLAVAVLGVTVLAVLALVAIEIVRSREPSIKAAASPTPVIEKITSSGDVINASISPDGKYVCFVALIGSGQSLWLRQLATGQDLELLPGGVGRIWGCTFTPDSTQVTYALKTSNDPDGTFYRVPTIGGQAERLVSDLDSPVSFSPDGNRMTWLRASFPDAGESALMIANADGTEARPLAVRRAPDRFAPVFFARPSWSPDGTMIAVAVSREGEGARIYAFDPSSGAESVLNDRAWFSASFLAWLPDMSGLLAVARESAAGRTQIWILPWPVGVPRAVTNDVLMYQTVSCSADGRRIVTVAGDAAFQIWITPLDGRAAPRRLTTGPLAGGRGIFYTQDGRIVFSDWESVASIDGNGTGMKRYTESHITQHDASNFVAFGQSIAVRTYSGDVFLTNLEGGSERLIAHEAGITMAVSPDEAWLAYPSTRDGRIWKVPIQGGTPTRLTDTPAHSPAWSSDGSRMAYIETKDGGRDSLTVIGIVGGKVVWRRDLDSTQSKWSTVKWTKDGQGLILNNFGRGELRMYSLDGSVKSILDPSFGDIFSFDVSPTGDTIVFGRGYLKQDAYLISGFR